MRISKESTYNLELNGKELDTLLLLLRLTATNIKDVSFRPETEKIRDSLLQLISKTLEN